MADLNDFDDKNQLQIDKSVVDKSQTNKIKNVEKPFQCTECDLAFTTNAARNIHAKSHKRSQTYKCKVCNFKTNKFLALRKHRLDECGVKKHICHECGSSFQSTEVLKAHMRHHTKELQCSDCNFTTYSKSGLTRHRTKMHREFKCAECKYTTGCKNQIKRHIAENHINEIDDFDSPEDPENDVFTCPFCEFVHSDSNNMEKHIQEFHEIDKPFPCTECDQDFYDDVELELHIMTEHEVFSCSQCDYKGSIDNFEMHMKTHNVFVKSSDILSCTLCEFTTTFADDLEDHIYEFHTKASVGQTKVAPEDHIYEFHTKTSVGQTKVAPEFELKNSNNTSKQGRKIKPKKWFDEDDKAERTNIEEELKEQSTSNKDQLFLRQGIDHKCTICGEFFVSKQGLNIHMNRKHENYECEECNKIFKTASGIKNHIENAHSSTQIISCAKCDYTCNTEMELRRHISVHNPTKGLSMHKDLLHSDLQGEIVSIQDPKIFISEKKVCGVGIADGSDYIENVEYEADPTSPDDSLCIDHLENLDDNTNIVDGTEHTKVKEVIDKSKPMIDEVRKINRKEKNNLEESRKNSDFEKLFNNEGKINERLENKTIEGKVKVEGQNDDEITDPEDSVGQSNDYIEEDDEDDLGVEGDYIGDMYEDEERTADDNIPNETTEKKSSVLNMEYNKIDEFDNIRKSGKFTGDRKKEVSAKNAHDGEGTIIHSKMKDLETVCNMKENDRYPNVKSDVLGLDFEKDDDLNFTEINMARPSRYIDESFIDKSKKRKADESLENSDTKQVTEMNEENEKIVIDADNDMDVWYGCSECDYVGPKQEFYEHIRKHGENQHFSCKDCEFRCNSKKDLNVHIAKNHTVVGHFACTECDFTTTSTTGIKIHRRIHVKSEFICGYCKTECFSIAALKEHHRFNHKGPVKVINLSNKGPVKVLDLYNENSVKRNEEFQSPNKESYIKIKKNKPEEALIISQKPSRRKIVAIPYKAGLPKLGTHMNVNLDEENGRSFIKLDGTNEKKMKRKFVAVPKVQNTMQVEYNESDEASNTTNEKKYQCKYCVFVAINRRGLSVHMRGMHGLTNTTVQYPKDTWVDTKLYACELCNFKASSNEKIAQHFRTHLGERPWTCQECGAKFTTKSARKIHEACHLEEKPFKCKYDGCKYATALKLNLANHYYIHTFKEKKARLLKKHSD